MTPSKPQVARQFFVYRERFFPGLPEIPILMPHMASLGEYHPPQNCPPHGLLLISRTIKAPAGWKGVLLHEMIHAALDRLGVDEWEHGTCAYHGPRFASVANRIGGELGLPMVAMEDSWSWPNHAWWGAGASTDMDE